MKINPIVEAEIGAQKPKVGELWLVKFPTDPHELFLREINRISETTVTFGHNALDRSRSFKRSDVEFVELVQ